MKTCHFLARSLAVISALAMLSLAAPSSAQQTTPQNCASTVARGPAGACRCRRSPAAAAGHPGSSGPQPVQATPPPWRRACARTATAEHDRAACRARGKLLKAAAAELRELSPWSMFMSADVLVKAVMIGLAFASLVTWTIFIAKMIELSRRSAQAARARSTRSATRARWRKRSSRSAPRAACCRHCWRRRCARRGCRRAFPATPASRSARPRALPKSCAPKRAGSGSAWDCLRPSARRRPSSDCSAPSGAS